MPAPQPSLDDLADALVRAQPFMGPIEHRVALTLYRLLAQRGPVTDPTLAAAVGLPEDEVKETLASWPGVLRDDSGAVIGFWGLSVVEVPPHRYRVNGVPLFTWCAWDALFLTRLLDARAEVESVDALTGDPIRLTVSPEGVESSSHPDAVVSFLAPDGKFDADVVTSFCHFVHFFATPENGTQWASEHADVFVVSLDDAFELGRRVTDPVLEGAAGD
ncbi:MAG: organomercurial lyase [Acidimicrobiales bacterium]